MSLELLCNELLLYVFEFVDDTQLFRAFYGLNHRFNALLFNRDRSCHFDFRSVYKRDFQTICETYAPLVVDRITSICFSESDDTPQQMSHYLDNSMPLRLFSNLRSLSLCHIRSYKTLEDISEEWHFLPNLTQLCFVQCHMAASVPTHSSPFLRCKSLVDRIWSLTKLIHCDFGVSFDKTSFQVPEVTSMSLKRLSIEHYNLNFSQLCQLIERTPCVQYLRISINFGSDDIKLSLAMPSITSLVLYTRNSPPAFRKLLKCMPNLKHLTVNSVDTYLGYVRNWLANKFREDMSYEPNLLRSSQSPPIYMNGYRWEDIIIKHLPKLQTFQLRMNTEYRVISNKEEDVNKLLRSFTGHVWTRKHQWFVRCDWSSNPDSGYLCLYTLPYAFNDFNAHSASIRSKSTSPNESDYWLYEHVRNLDCHYSLSDSSGLNRARFSNINHLSIDLPFNESILSTLSTFDHLKSISLFILNDDVKVYQQLQILLDQAPVLYSLKLSCDQLLSPELGLLKIRSTSVRCLDLDGYTKHIGWDCFDNQQRVALYNSSLGARCEVLRMKVQNVMNVIELVYSMPYLRALNVLVLDEDNLPDSEISSTNDKLVHWLRDSLDPTCTIVRHNCDSRYIQLWIR